MFNFVQKIQGCILATTMGLVININSNKFLFPKECTSTKLCLL